MAAPYPVRGTTSTLRWASALVGLAAVGCAAVAAFVADSTGDRVGGAAVALFLALAAAMPFALRRRLERVVFVVTDDGLEIPRRGLVRWAEIEEIRIVDGRHGTYFGLEPTQDAAVRTSLGGLARAARILNRPLGYPTLAWPETILPVELDELLRKVETRAGTRMPAVRRTGGSILEEIPP